MASQGGYSGQTCYLRTGKRTGLKQFRSLLPPMLGGIKKEKKNYFYTVYPEVHKMEKECCGVNF